MPAVPDVASSDAAPPDLHGLLRSRRTINEFAPALPSGWEDSLRRAVHAATYAPNHRRTEPWFRAPELEAEVQSSMLLACASLHERLDA